MKPESAVLSGGRTGTETASFKDCSEGFRMGAGSGSHSVRLLEGRTGGVLEAFVGLGRNSGRDEISWTLCGCSAWSKGLSCSGMGEDGLE